MGELEECQTLDWTSMNSKEVTGGKERKRRDDEEEGVIWTASCDTLMKPSRCPPRLRACVLKRA